MRLLNYKSALHWQTLITTEARNVSTLKLTCTSHVRYFQAATAPAKGNATATEYHASVKEPTVRSGRS